MKKNDNDNIGSTDFVLFDNIDIDQLKMIVGNDEQICTFLLNELFDQIECAFKSFDEYIEVQNILEIKKTAHTIRGASSQLGINFVYKYMINIENICENIKNENDKNINDGNVKKINITINELKPLYNTLKENFDNIVKMIK